jgi:hypothetical protein
MMGIIQTIILNLTQNLHNLWNLWITLLLGLLHHLLLQIKEVSLLVLGRYSNPN